MSWLFGLDDFPARWHCGAWTSVHGWTHILSNAGIALAYLALSVFIFSRWARVGHDPMAWWFSAFIGACGLGHVLEIIVFWVPIYRIMAACSVATAVISLGAAAVVWRLR